MMNTRMKNNNSEDDEMDTNIFHDIKSFADNLKFWAEAIVKDCENKDLESIMESFDSAESAIADIKDCLEDAN